MEEFVVTWMNEMNEVDTRSMKEQLVALIAEVKPYLVYNLGPRFWS